MVKKTASTGKKGTKDTSKAKYVVSILNNRRKPMDGTTIDKNEQHISSGVLIPKIIKEIIIILGEHGGSLTIDKCEAIIREKYKSESSTPWYEKNLKSGNNNSRWRHSIVGEARNRAKKLGYLKKVGESGIGIWELTDEGTKYYQELIK